MANRGTVQLSVTIVILRERLTRSGAGAVLHRQASDLPPCNGALGAAPRPVRQRPHQHLLWGGRGDLHDEGGGALPATACAGVWPAGDRPQLPPGRGRQRSARLCQRRLMEPEKHRLTVHMSPTPCAASHYPWPGHDAGVLLLPASVRRREPACLASWAMVHLGREDPKHIENYANQQARMLRTCGLRGTPYPHMVSPCPG